MILPPAVFRDLASNLPGLTQIGLVGPNQISPWLHLPDPLLQRTCATALALQFEFFRVKPLPDWRAAPPDACTFGFIAIDAAIEATLRASSNFDLISGSFTFGAAILVSGGSTEGSQRFLTFMSVAGMAFPVIAIAGTVLRQGNPPSPNHVPNAGACACWARPGSAGFAVWREAIVTAEHVVRGLGLGTTVGLLRSAHHASPSRATLIDVGQGCIDAAVLEIATGSWPASLHALAVPDPAVAAIAPGSSTTLSSRYTTQTGTVLRVNQNPGYFGPMMGERIVIDVPGIAGDSGGLVSGATPGDGLGVYMGTIPSVVAGARDGLAQGLWQVTQWFDADVFA